jgi:L,D-peptidoglycan transpeptidase YkuD (ErfK/YbiS/YcfS/YnhG family)
MLPGEPVDRLQRADALYDLIIEINHNQRPRISGRGSAVFIHVARPDMTPTAGCVSMPAGTLRRLVARLGPETMITIHG